MPQSADDKYAEIEPSLFIARSVPIFIDENLIAHVHYGFDMNEKKYISTQLD